MVSIASLFAVRHNEQENLDINIADFEDDPNCNQKTPSALKKIASIDLELDLALTFFQHK